MATTVVQLPVPIAEPPIIASTPIPAQKDEGPAFDASEIRNKYLEERDKRLRARPEGNEQYKQFTGNFSKYLKDPYSPRIQREPMDIETDFLVLGGGFGGLSVGAKLIEAGITNMRIMDKAGDFGGTWYYNRYVFITGLGFAFAMLTFKPDILARLVILVCPRLDAITYYSLTNTTIRVLHLHATARRDGLYPY